MPYNHQHYTAYSYSPTLSLRVCVSLEEGGYGAGTVTVVVRNLEWNTRAMNKKFLREKVNLFLV